MDKHTANGMLNVRNENFDNTVLSNHFPEQSGYGWYPPDLNPCNYFLWGFLKDKIYKNNHHTIKELQQKILPVVNSISKETLAAIGQNFWHWMQMVVDIDGVHVDFFNTIVISQD